MKDALTKRGPFVIAGGSGFIGVSLAMHLAAAGWRVVILSRHAPAIAGPWGHVPWDARTLGDWRGSLNGAAGVVNLVGRSVDCIKTPDHRDEILRSRVESTLVLGEAMRRVEYPPPVWVQMSTAHIYGDPPEVICTEDSPTASAWRRPLDVPGSRPIAKAFCRLSGRWCCGRVLLLAVTAERVVGRSRGCGDWFGWV